MSHHIGGYVRVSGEAVRTFRKQAVLSPSELALEANVDESTVRRLERGGRRALPRTVRRLSDALGTLPIKLVEPE